MIVIHPEGGAPAYRQIIDQVKTLVGAGALRPGDKLPSIRELALKLGLNPLTIQKAYDRLAEEGVLAKELGRGVYVAETAMPKLDRTEREERIRPMLAATAAEGRRLGIPPARLLKLFSDAVEKTD